MIPFWGHSILAQIAKQLKNKIKIFLETPYLQIFTPGAALYSNCEKTPALNG